MNCFPLCAIARSPLPRVLCKSSSRSVKWSIETSLSSLKFNDSTSTVWPVSKLRVLTIQIELKSFNKYQNLIFVMRIPLYLKELFIYFKPKTMKIKNKNNVKLIISKLVISKITYRAFRRHRSWIQYLFVTCSKIIPTTRKKSKCT